MRWISVLASLLFAVGLSAQTVKTSRNSIHPGKYYREYESAYVMIGLGQGDMYGGMLGLNAQFIFNDHGKLRWGLVVGYGLSRVQVANRTQTWWALSVEGKVFLWQNWFLAAGAGPRVFENGTNGLHYHEPRDLLSPISFYGAVLQTGIDSFMSKYFGYNLSAGIGYSDLGPFPVLNAGIFIPISTP